MANDRQFKPKSRRLPPLNALKAFEVAARHESLVRAAAELNVTHGAISKQIRALEEDFGEALFHRRNRGLFLTERGRQLSMSLSSVFTDLENTLADFRMHREDHPLVVSCEPTLCLKLLIPRLAEFETEAGFSVRVLAAGGHIDFCRDHIDLAIRRNDFAVDPTIHIRVLAAEMMGVVCSPAIAAQMASSKRARHPALHTRSRPDAWTRWQKKRTNMKFTGDIAYEHFYLAIEAALAGQGFALASIHMVLADIAQGRLQAVTGFEPDGTRYIALSQREFTEGSRVTRFADWLASIMTATVEGQTS